MRDGALKWALRLLGIALFIGPFLIALGMHNWDIREAVLPSDEEMSQVTSQITDMFGDEFSPDTLTVGSPVISSNNVRLPVTFKSPLKMPIKITDISVTVVDQGATVGQLHLEEGMLEIPASGTVSFALVGTYTGTIPSDPQLGDMSFTLEVYGVTVQVNPSMQGGWS
ncbi:MAG: hypothetical protein ABH852_04945 [Methanobacteriota archaeon]